ncbi:hypothetical protein G5C51_36990 [Streptomyces sp. A7024]|uniref:Integral membrane protein n=1 Tax=Streptomyces coryli TaxID=1128680 RepID=A0A6G4UBT4_9ACTN|nr:hypothetical protein [Streptomyces coryli]NGN69472.1 hypothetical protein [Streptomyces coryli]
MTSMTNPRPYATVALLIAAAGIPIQIAGGADYPTVPPGLFILLAAAGLYAVRTRWAPVVAFAATVMIAIGGIVAPELREQLAAPSDAAVFAGSALQTAALLAGLAYGAAAVRQSLRGRERAAAH